MKNMAIVHFSTWRALTNHTRGFCRHATATFYEDFWRLRRHLVEKTEYCLFELPAAVFTRREPPKRLLMQSDKRVQALFRCTTRPISERRHLG